MRTHPLDNPLTMPYLYHMSKNKKPQAPKSGRDEEWMRAKLDQARSRTQPRPVGTLYKRKPKHVNKGWD